MNRIFVKCCITSLVLIVTVSLFIDSTAVQAGLQPRQWLDTEGLYYLDEGPNSQGEKALVITRTGKRIPPKANDPSAPTLPGFHVAGKRFRFASYSVSTRSISFGTVSVGGVSYSFTGRVGHEDIESIKNVPYVVRTLVTKEGVKTRKQKVALLRFERAD